MSSRQRQSTASASTPASRHRESTASALSSKQRTSTSSAATPAPPRSAAPATELPPYQPPSQPLNENAQHQLANLYQRQGIAKLKEHYDKAAKLLEESGGEINDRLTEKTEDLRKRKARRDRDGNADEAADRAEEAELARMRERVEGMTKRMDAGIRKAIDGEAGLRALDTALREAQGKARAASMSATQATNTQRTLATVTDNGSDGAPDPTNPSSAIAVPQLVPAFESSVENHIDAYQSLPLQARYAHHNTYVTFKRVVHDAQHPGDSAPPLPAATTWFTRAAGSTAPEPGVTAQAGDDEDDDDIAIARERISTRCPLTLRDFEEPVTSRKCPHSYEKSAIASLIAQGRGEARCPVAGCEKPITMQDLWTDAVLVRKIKRIMRARERERDGVDEDGMAEESGGGVGSGGLGGAEEIESDSGEDIDAMEEDDDEEEGRGEATAVGVKAESVTRRRRDDIEDD